MKSYNVTINDRNTIRVDSDEDVAWIPDNVDNFVVYDRELESKRGKWLYCLYTKYFLQVQSSLRQLKTSIVLILTDLLDPLTRI